MSHEGSTGPDSFFHNQALYGKYRWPTVIVMLSGIIWALQPVATYYAIDPEAQDLIQNAVAVDTMINFLVPAFLWLGFWIAFVSLTYFLGGRLRAGRMFKLTAWGMAPFALVGAVRAAGKYYVYQDATIPIGVTVGRFPSEWRGYNEMLAESASDQLLVGTIIGSCVFLLLSAYLWMYAVRYSTNLEDRKKIATIVAIPTLIYIGYSIISAFGFSIGPLS